MNKFLMVSVFASFLLYQSFAFAADGEEGDFLKVINSFRSSLSISALAEDSILSLAAKNHAAWMANKGRLSHSGPGLRTSADDRIRAAGSTDWATGEVIARGSFQGKLTFKQWFFSPSHLKIMLAPRYDKIGVSRAGCTAESDPWYCFWVADFSGSKAVAQNSNLVFSNQELIDAARAALAGELDAEQVANFHQ